MFGLRIELQRFLLTGLGLARVLRQHPQFPKQVVNERIVRRRLQLVRQALSGLFRVPLRPDRADQTSSSPPERSVPDGNDERPAYSCLILPCGDTHHREWSPRSRYVY